MSSQFFKTFHYGGIVEFGSSGGSDGAFGHFKTYEMRTTVFIERFRLGI